MLPAGESRHDRGGESVIIHLRAPRRAVRIGVAVLWLAGSGCTALREVPRNQIGARPERKDVRLVTREGLVYEFDFIRVEGDTMVGYRRRDVEGPIEEYATLRVPLDDVGSLKARSIDWVRTGLIGGAIAAAVVTAALIRRGSDDGGSGESPPVKPPIP
jgi:hypothetical protein